MQQQEWVLLPSVIECAIHFNHLGTSLVPCIPPHHQYLLLVFQPHYKLTASLVSSYTNACPLCTVIHSIVPEHRGEQWFVV